MAVSARTFLLRGIVQGVGFRPFVHRAAVALGLRGRVRNEAGSVRVHAEGEATALAALGRLLREGPPGSRVLACSSRAAAPAGYDDFRIDGSAGDGAPRGAVPPDLAPCADCLRELADPADRRHRYPFLACTRCGPRYTVSRALPYDRERTSLAPFPLCRACAAEYGDPSDRRFHAEAAACPACGPTLRLLLPDGTEGGGGDPVGAAAAALAAGKVVALKGVGGFHLAVDAGNDPAVALLRERKGRPGKPFAVMVPHLAAARALARLSRTDEAILSSPAAPILLCPLRPGAPLSPRVAPGLSRAGIFLPPSPLHRLLLDALPRPLVMTSGNLSEEPIVTDDGDALARLGAVADLFLVHDREVVRPCDDSVAARVGRLPYPLRRARGAVPAPVLLPPFRRRRGAPDAVGLGAELKGTACFLRGDGAFLTPPVGDLSSPRSREAYRDAYAFLRDYLGARPVAACHDLHPAYFTTAFAAEAGAERTFPLQHHRAHLLALAAETGLRGKAVGVAFDGTGHGDDGSAWGGEFFSLEDGGESVERAGHLRPFPLQGGDSAVRNPWKTALCLLREILPPGEAAGAFLRAVGDGDACGGGAPSEGEARLVLEAAEKGILAVPCTSAGRLFDGAAAILGLSLRASYEAEGALRMEGALPKGSRPPYPFAVERTAPLVAIDWRGTVEALLSDRLRRVPPAECAARFLGAVAAMVAEGAAEVASRTGARTVLLSGGVFQNVPLLSRAAALLVERGLVPRIHRAVPANDGGISLGQAYHAALRLAGG